MNGNKLSARSKMAIAIAAIVFIVYNIILGVVFFATNDGNTFRGASFWISYAFMFIALAVLGATGFLLKSRNIQPRDWLFGYPIFKHSTIYIIVELIASVLFMLLDSPTFPWWISFVVQIIILAAHLILIISCLIAQETIMEVQNKIKDGTDFIKFLLIDVEMVAEKAKDPVVKDAFTKLADQVRFSDPMSNDVLFELEKQIALQVNNADCCVGYNDSEGAMKYCEYASQLLTERNKKCKALK